jgi:hypothetical protein
MPLLAAAAGRDLEREWQLWSEIASCARERRITELRALDIVAWWAGDNGRRGVRRRHRTG